jgi:hypothetical protein
MASRKIFNDKVFELKFSQGSCGGEHSLPNAWLAAGGW